MVLWVSHPTPLMLMYFFAGFFNNLTLWYMTKLRVLVLSFPDFTDISNVPICFYYDCFARLFSWVPSKLQQISAQIVLRINKAENQRHSFQEMLTLIINDHPSASFDTLKFNTQSHNGRRSSLTQLSTCYDCTDLFTGAFFLQFQRGRIQRR
jgi:hypothetical protein